MISLKESVSFSLTMGTTPIPRSVSIVFMRLRHLLLDLVSSWVRSIWLAVSPTPANASMYMRMSTICPTEARACFLAISLGFLFRPTASMPHAIAPAGDHDHVHGPVPYGLYLAGEVVGPGPANPAVLVQQDRGAYLEHHPVNISHKRGLRPFLPAIPSTRRSRGLWLRSRNAPSLPARGKKPPSRRASPGRRDRSY